MPTLLPKTDTVFLREPGQEHRVVNWDRLIENAGDFIKPQGIYPERYRVCEFPAEETLAAMGNELESL